jgi:16S rRNA U1498 N3-methylase RsmE
MRSAIANTHRFFVDALTFANATTTDANLLHQWSRVLRLRVDQQVMLLDGLGQAAVVRVTELTPNGRVGRSLIRLWLRVNHACR